MNKVLFLTLVILNVCWGAPTDTNNGAVTADIQIDVNNKKHTVTVTDKIPPGPDHNESTTLVPPPPPTTPTTIKPNSTTVTPKTTTTATTTPNPNVTTTVTPKPPPGPTPNPTPSPTPIPSSSSTTPHSSTTANPKPTGAPPSNRKFDGPSFVGGIVLAAGLMAIGFVAFKFYKARTELNYHTL